MPEERKCLLWLYLSSRHFGPAPNNQTQLMWKLTSPTSNWAAHRLACHCTTTAQQSTASLAHNGRSDASFRCSSLRLPFSSPNRTPGGRLLHSDQVRTRHCRLTTAFLCNFTGRRRMHQSNSGSNGIGRSLRALTFASYAGEPAASGNKASACASNMQTGCTLLLLDMLDLLHRHVKK